MNNFNIRLKSRYELFVDYLVIALMVLYISGASAITKSHLFVLFSFIVLCLIFIVRKRHIDVPFLLFLAIWCFINLISSLVNDLSTFSLPFFLNETGRMIMAYLMIKIVGPSLFNKFSKFTFPLIVLSLFLFTFQLLGESIFHSLAPKLNFLTQELQKQAGGWSLFVYTFNGFAVDRNSGFMWEPGAYAAILIFFLYYRLFINNFKVDIKVIIILIALFTTFSTAGYLALFVFIICYFTYHRKAIFPILLLPFAVIYGIYYYHSTDFLNDKIERYIDIGTASWEEESVDGERYMRMSRLGIFVASVEGAIYRPLGSGVLANKHTIEKYGNEYGPNFLAKVLQQWGWLGILFFYYALYKFTRHWCNSQLMTYSFLLSISIVLFSNPFTFRYLMFCVVFFPFISENRYMEYYLNYKMKYIDRI